MAIKNKKKPKLNTSLNNRLAEKRIFRGHATSCIYVHVCVCVCVFIYKFKNMSSATYKILLPISIMVLWMCCIKASRELQENEEIPALMAFGDSILDTGNNNDLISVLKCNFPPYGMDFIGGKPTGRFCDGKVLTDLIGM